MIEMIPNEQMLDTICESWMGITRHEAYTIYVYNAFLQKVRCVAHYVRRCKCFSGAKISFS